VLIARKHVDDAVQGLGAIVRMQGRDAQMPRAGERDGRLHGFTVANLADQDHVRSRAHGAAQGACEGLGVEADFALVHDRLLVGVQELDRILDGQNMVR